MSRNALRLFFTLLVSLLLSSVVAAEASPTALKEATDSLQVALGTKSHSDSDTKSVQSPKERQTSLALGESDLNDLVAGNTKFALELYHSLRQKGENIFFSPHSISLAFAMTYGGARNQSEREIAKTFYFTLPQPRLHETFNALDLKLAGRGKEAKGQDQGGFRLNVANALWGQRGHPFLPQFIDQLAINYGAGLRLLDFQHKPEDSRTIINDWVSEQTEAKIRNLIPPGVINDLTRLLLTNAVYFNAAWAQPFRQEYTRDDQFHLLDGNRVTVPMMAQTKYFPYTEGDTYQSVELHYDGRELSMVILLPRPDRFQEFENSLDPERVDLILKTLAPRNVRIKMPRFRYEYGPVSLKTALNKMGMSLPFMPGSADFSGMDGTRDLFITDALHKAFVSVDEEGTEAAAATVVAIGDTSVPPPPVEFIVDRPFIFFIRDIETGAVLFLGRVANPAD
jgi:serpin B